MNDEKPQSFAALGADPRFTARLGDRNIHVPTAIQGLVIPRLAAGENVLFRAATGTGKTFAYLLPMLQKTLNQGEVEPSVRRVWTGPAVLVCAPTYELCSQIKAEVDFLLKDFAPASEGPDAAGGDSFSSSLLIGSVSLNRQIESLKKTKPLIVVGNAGRLVVLAKMGKLKFRDLRCLVLDEADRLVSDEMRAETEELVGLIKRALGGNSIGALQTAACSATLAPKSKERLLPLLGAFGRDGGKDGGAEGGGRSGVQIIETDEQEILRERIEHWAIFSEGRRKIQTLRSFLAAAKPKKTLVFSGRGAEAENIVTQLQHHHLSAAGLYGDMDKKGRKEAIEGFRSGKISVLVSSDLAARGLDIAGLTHIVALDVPEEQGPYIHRAGRTGRAGRRGVMVSIGDEDEMRRLAIIEKKLGIKVYPKELYGGKVCTPDNRED
jgi:superfamily II DNA/RNA helicase